MTILVTGACGFVGAHVIAALARHRPGEALVAADLAPPPPAVATFWRDARVTFHRLDVADRAAVREAIAVHRPAYVVHMAAITPSPAMEAADPVRIVDVNIGGAANVIDAATAAPGIRRVVTLSSTVVYGFSPTLPSPLGEDHPVDAVGLYAISKVACEGLSRRFGMLRGVSTVAARIAAVYGEMERPTGHRETMSQLYPLFAALREKRRITVCPSAALRDWTHADDIGDGLCALIAAPHLSHPVYNVSHGVGLTFAEVIELFRAGGLAVDVVDDPARAEAAFDPALGRPPLSVERLALDTGFRAERDLQSAIAAVAAGGWR